MHNKKPHYVPSEFCPQCGGDGVVVICSFVVACDLCKANSVGNAHITYGDLNHPSFIDSMIATEESDSYWEWLRLMVNEGQIEDPWKLDVQKEVKSNHVKAKRGKHK